MADPEKPDTQEQLDRPKRPIYKRLWFRLGGLLFLLGLFVALGVVGFIGWNYVRLPEVAELKNIEFTEPLKIYTRDGILISEIGEIKRTPVEFSAIPLRLQQAFLAAEDARFYEHAGIDYFSLARAITQYVSDSRQQTGASTITMQLAREFYLTKERTLWRKFREILLAIKIELELPKEKIFDLYLNVVFFGHKSYGVAAAALTYYNARLEDLTLAQMAAIAALPKAPSALNPIANPERNLERRNWIIGRMLELGFIDEITAATAKAEAVDANPYRVEPGVRAGYVAENVRLSLLKPGMLAEEGVSTDFLYNNGIRVYTTIDAKLQQAANASSFAGLLHYEERHGFKGAIRHFSLFDDHGPDLPVAVSTAPTDATDDSTDKTPDAPVFDTARLRLMYPSLDDTLAELEEIENYSNRLTPALVVWVEDSWVVLLTAGGEMVNLSFKEHFPFKGVFVKTDKLRTTKGFHQLLEPGDVVYLRNASIGESESKNADQTEGADTHNWLLAQAPSAQTALISLDPSDGSVLAMVGGADFKLSQFNRATQAERLIGSNIKPIIYAYGFEHGLAPGSVFVDGPITNNENWRPQNSGLSFLGPITLRRALALSRNLVSVRLLDHLGVKKVVDYVEQLEITNKPPRDLSLALGTASFSPQNAARAMSMFANGGHLVQANLIETVQDSNHNLLYARPALGVCMKKIINAYKPSKAARAKATAAAELAALVDGTGDVSNQEQSRATEPETPQQPEEQTEAQLLTTSIELGQGGVGDLFDKSWAGRYCAKDQASPPRHLNATSAYLMHHVMRDVIRFGTGKRARKLGRNDYAGKTGTTNETIDAWFTGVHPMLVTSVWVGFDNPATLGALESGSQAALPTWINYMQLVQDRLPVVHYKRPNTVLSAYIDPTTGEGVGSHFPDAVRELFTEDSMPKTSAKILVPEGDQSSAGAPKVLNRPEDIF